MDTQLGGHRITPACAGRRRNRYPWATASTDHPRMRGEENRQGKTDALGTGSPPHARGGAAERERRDAEVRITPACAGRSVVLLGDRPGHEDHPRMRGEEDNSAQAQDLPAGSPPHARGGANRLEEVPDSLRITPACAGRSCPRCPCRSQISDHPRMRGEENRL